MFDPRYFVPKTKSGLLTLGEVAEIAESLRRGELAVLPTETGYMLAALATSPEALLRAFELKGRSTNHPMHVACASLRMAEEYAALTSPALRVMGAFTPGPVTVVARQTGKLPDTLVTHNGTVGIRIPDHAATLQVIEAVGMPVTATSLNESSQEALSVDRETLQQLPWPSGQIVRIVRDDQALAYDRPSTLVRVIDDEIEVLREGPVSRAEIELAAICDTAGAFAPATDRPESSERHPQTG